MDFPNIRIKNFEGPFDLLLHLIKKNQMDIYNVEISKITNQYLKYLDDMKVMDLELTSEFIVVAATLIEIKSKHLLPKSKKEDEEEEDQEKNLLEKLIVYRKIKKAAEFFKEKHISSGELYTKKPEIIEEIKIPESNEDLLKNLTLLELYNMYNNLLEIYNNKRNTANVIQKKIFVDKYKIEDKMDHILLLLKENEVNRFSEIMAKCECKLECIVSFLALLEMIKLRKIKVYQSNNFNNIIIERRDEVEEE
ncbi:segregation/condensation protein A [Clostridium weizhouense]|uniref:Segregation and condensation protein A n=1 Tax=Clostridium weizhouense TaxID=2859781 RepID=A0ABS7AMS2_9CLOT|nr:segregation/condensation protein A [Clostridium weizhouense]MBW6409378.1 segregation/condensation protein A [Clostridium weizhouense]